jgi:putative ABC transport system substrate-binding protein
MMDRRTFIATLAGGLPTAPPAAEAQRSENQVRRRQFRITAAALIAAPIAAKAERASGKAARIGYLTGRALDFERLWLAAFREGLRDLGYVGGQSIVIEERHAAGRPEKLPELAAELVRLKVDVLVATESLSAIEAKKATSAIPIVSLTQDPVALGLVNSIARPGGNITGLSDYHAGMAHKRLELLREIIPSASRFAVFLDPAIRPNLLQLQDLQAAAPAMRLTLLPFEIKGADDVARAFATMAKRRVDGLVLLRGAAMSRIQPRIAELAIAARTPAIYTVALWAEIGGLIAYGTDFNAYFRRAATVVDRILKGAKPADLPIEQPTKFELVINLKTAKALGLTIPPALLQRADHVIE